MLPGLGHIPQMEDPDFFNEALLKALRKHKFERFEAGDIMDIIRLCAWGYAALLGFVILTGYIPPSSTPTT